MSVIRICEDLAQSRVARKFLESRNTLSTHLQVEKSNQGLFSPAKISNPKKNEAVEEQYTTIARKILRNKQLPIESLWKLFCCSFKPYQVLNEMMPSILKSISVSTRCFEDNQGWREQMNITCPKSRLQREVRHVRCLRQMALD